MSRLMPQLSPADADSILAAMAKPKGGKKFQTMGGGLAGPDAPDVLPQPAPPAAGPPGSTGGLGTPPSPPDMAELMRTLNSGKAFPKAAATDADSASSAKAGPSPPEPFTSTVTTGSGTTSYDYLKGPNGSYQQAGVRGGPDPQTLALLQNFNPEGYRQTGVPGAMPVSHYLTQLTGYGYGQVPMQMDPALRAAALGLQAQDADRLLKQMDQASKYGLEGQKLFQSGQQFDQTQKLAREGMAQQAQEGAANRQNQLSIAQANHSPQAVKSQIMAALAARAATDPTFKLGRMGEMIGQLDQWLNTRPPGQAPAPPAAGTAIGGVAGAMGQAGATPAGPNPLAPPLSAANNPFASEDKAADILRQLQPLVGTGQGPTFAAKKAADMTPADIDAIVGRLQGVDLKDPAVQAELQNQIQSGALGDVQTLRRLAAQDLANRYLLTQKPKRVAGGIGNSQYAGTYEIPDYFKLSYQRPTGIGPTVGGAFKKMANFDFPWNKIQLPTGEVYDFDPADPFKIMTRGEHGQPDLGTRTLLMDMLLGRLGKPPAGR